MIYTICRFGVLVDNNLKYLYFLLSMSKLEIIHPFSLRKYLNTGVSKNIKVLDSENYFKIEYLNKTQKFAIAISFPNCTSIEYKSIPSIVEILKDISEEEAKLYFEINYK